jgi:hypothetical protein
VGERGAEASPGTSLRAGAPSSSAMVAGGGQGGLVPDHLQVGADVAALSLVALEIRASMDRLASQLDVTRERASTASSAGRALHVPPDMDAVLAVVASAYQTVGTQEIERLRALLVMGKDGNDGLNEAESVQLQMAMDRQSKMMSTLSNLLKKAEDTDEGISQNIK